MKNIVVFSLCFLMCILCITQEKENTGNYHSPIIIKTVHQEDLLPEEKKEPVKEDTPLIVSREKRISPARKKYRRIVIEAPDTLETISTKIEALTGGSQSTGDSSSLAIAKSFRQDSALLEKISLSVPFNKPDSQSLVLVNEFQEETKPAADDIKPIDSTSTVIANHTEEQLDALKAEPEENFSIAEGVHNDSLTVSGSFRQDSVSLETIVFHTPEQEIKLTPDNVQLIDSTCAVLIYPTEEQLARLKVEHGENFRDFEEIYVTYQELAIEMLDSIDIETINAEKRHLSFYGKNSETVTIDIRKEGTSPWSLIFFHENKEPQIVPLGELSHEKVIEYFDILSKEKILYLADDALE